MNTPQRVEHAMTDKGYVPLYATGIVEQPWATYSDEDHATWGILYRRQRDLLPGRACSAFLEAQDAMGMGEDMIPKFAELNEILREKTGWTLVGVEGLLPELDFFDHLANRRFPVTWWIRKPEQIDYIAEPDLFHDLFGHVPLLMNPVFADYMQAYGRGGLRALGLGRLHNLARLYWYTVEFGLLDTPEGLRIFGAGIVSSHAESIFCLEDPSPNRLGFDLERVMRTPYRIDDFQQTYFVTPSLRALLEATLQDFDPIYARLDRAPDLGITDILPQDRVYTRGSQAYATAPQ